MHKNRTNVSISEHKLQDTLLESERVRINIITYYISEQWLANQLRSFSKKAPIIIIPKLLKILK